MHWFSDHEYQTIEKEIVISCVDTLICDEQNRVLLGRRCKGPVLDWWVFGGRMSGGENFEDTVRRTLLKELGISNGYTWLDVLGPYLLHYVDNEHGTFTHLMNTPVVRVNAGSIDTASFLKSDHNEVAWFDIIGDSTQVFHPYLRRVLNDALAVMHNSNANTEQIH